MQAQALTMAADTGEQSNAKDLCLLSLDGGGVRGLSSLMILNRIMECLRPEDPPRPCDVFDMIGGTSTGGLIAIMLGRLRMTAKEAIDAYLKLSPKIFTKKRSRLGWNLAFQAQYDGDALKAGVKEMLLDRGLDEDALLKDDSDSQCRT